LGFQKEEFMEFIEKPIIDSFETVVSYECSNFMGPFFICSSNELTDKKNMEIENIISKTHRTVDKKSGLITLMRNTGLPKLDEMEHFGVDLEILSS
jgi:hypothetical protein